MSEPAEAGGLEQKALQALTTQVDWETARVSNVRAGELHAICGEVASDIYPVPRPFIVLPGGEAVVNLHDRVRVEDLQDSFAGFYLEMCASAEEKEEANRLARAAAEEQAARELDSFLANMAAAKQQELKAEAAAADPQPTAERPKESSRAETFSDAVIRPQSE